MKKVIGIIPHLFTAGNLICGVVAIIHILAGDLKFGAYLVGIAALLDFFDGFVARALGVSGEFGKQFDSLADCVTFGVVPGMVMMVLIEKSLTISDFTFSMETIISFFSKEGAIQIPPKHFISYIALLIPVFSAVRLAKFNIDTRQSDSFIGLPTPANAIFILSLGYLSLNTDTNAFVQFLLMRYEFLVAITIIFSIFLVAEIPLFALKFKNFSWSENKIRFIFLGTSLFLLLIFHIAGLPLIIILYLFFSFINIFFNKRKVI